MPDSYTQTAAIHIDDAFPVIIRRTKSNSPQAVGIITAAQLVKRHSVPQRDSRNKSGYQRPVSVARVNKLANDLRTGRVDLPTAVLLNVRDGASTIVESVDGGVTMFRPNGHELFVVDGQHRIEALSKLVEENEEKWSGYQLPFVCMLGADEIEEMTQFYVVNSTAKSVRTDLALDLLKQRAENDPDLMASLVEKGEDWKVEGQTIAEDLARTRLWEGPHPVPWRPVGRDDHRLRWRGQFAEAAPRDTIFRTDFDAEPAEDPERLLGGNRAGSPGCIQNPVRIRASEEHRGPDHAFAAHLGD